VVVTVRVHMSLTVDMQTLVWHIFHVFRQTAQVSALCCTEARYDNRLLGSQLQLKLII